MNQEIARWDGTAWVCDAGAVGPNTVGSDEIVDASITTIDLSDGAITDAKLGADVGVRGYEVVQSERLIRVGMNSSFDALCPIEKIAVGGGFGYLEDGVQVVQSRPGGSNRTWTVTFFASDADATAVVYAVCVNGS